MPHSYITEIRKYEIVSETDTRVKSMFLNFFCDVAFGQYFVYEVTFDCNHEHNS